MNNRKLMYIFVIVCLIFIFSCILSYFNSWSSSSDGPSLSKYDLLKYEKYVKNNKENTNDKIAVLDIYYEALCPDSKNFINNQLALLIGSDGNTKNVFKKHRDEEDLDTSLLATSKDTFLKVNLIPFGKANVSY